MSGGDRSTLPKNPRLIGPLHMFSFVPFVIMGMRASIMACKFGLAIFVSRYLDLPSLGIYGLSAGAVAVAPVVIGMGMVHLLMRDAVTHHLTEVTDALRHYWSFTTAVYGLVMTIVLLASVTMGWSKLWPLVVAVSLFEHVGNDVFHLLSNLQRPLTANASAFLRGAAWILLYTPLAIWNPALRSLPVLFGFWLAGSGLALLLFVGACWRWPWKDALGRPFRAAWIVTTVRCAFVLYLSDLSYIASQYLDRYLVTLFLGLEFAGVYFLYWSVANAVNTFVSMAVMQLQRPLLIKAYYRGGTAAHRAMAAKFLRSTAWATAALGVAIGAGFQMFVPLLNLQAVANHFAAFWLIMAAMSIRIIADFGAMALFTARSDRLMTTTNVVSAFAVALAQAIMLPLAGLFGAGVASFSTFLLILLWRYKLLFPSLTLTAHAQQVEA